MHKPVFTVSLAVLSGGKHLAVTGIHLDLHDVFVVRNHFNFVDEKTVFIIKLCLEHLATVFGKYQI